MPGVSGCFLRLKHRITRSEQEEENSLLCYLVLSHGDRDERYTPVKWAAVSGHLRAGAHLGRAHAVAIDPATLIHYKARGAHERVEPRGPRTWDRKGSLGGVHRGTPETRF